MTTDRKQVHTHTACTSAQHNCFKQLKQKFKKLLISQVLFTENRVNSGKPTFSHRKCHHTCLNKPHHTWLDKPHQT